MKKAPKESLPRTPWYILENAMEHLESKEWDEASCEAYGILALAQMRVARETDEQG